MNINYIDESYGYSDGNGYGCGYIHGDPYGNGLGYNHGNDFGNYNHDMFMCCSGYGFGEYTNCGYHSGNGDG